MEGKECRLVRAGWSPYVKERNVRVTLGYRRYR